jgi:hypothetical protein
MPRDLLVSLLAIAALVPALYGAARLVGLGRCRDCNRGCVPWDAYCWEHRP